MVTHATFYPTRLTILLMSDHILSKWTGPYSGTYCEEMHMMFNVQYTDCTLVSLSNERQRQRGDVLLRVRVEVASVAGLQAVVEVVVKILLLPGFNIVRALLVFRSLIL